MEIAESPHPPARAHSPGSVIGPRGEDTQLGDACRDVRIVVTRGKEDPFLHCAALPGEPSVDLPCGDESLSRHERRIALHGSWEKRPLPDVGVHKGQGVDALEPSLTQ